MGNPSMQHRKEGGKKKKKKGERQGVVWCTDCPFISCIALLLQLAVLDFRLLRASVQEGIRQKIIEGANK